MQFRIGYHARSRLVASSVIATSRVEEVIMPLHHRLIPTAALALVAAMSAGVAMLPQSPQDKPPAPPAAAPPEQPAPQMPPAPGEHHKWLEQLVGEWTVQSEMTNPGGDAIKGVGTDSVRSVGGRWVVNDLKMDIEGMGSMHAVSSIGYDSVKGNYQGTWVDSIQDHLWVYTGTLDPTGKTLTLEAEGPSMTGEGTTRYRDAITIADKDHRTLNSSALVNGEWVHFGTTLYTKLK